MWIRFYKYGGNTYKGMWYLLRLSADDITAHVPILCRSWQIVYAALTFDGPTALPDLVGASMGIIVNEENMM